MKATMTIELDCHAEPWDGLDGNPSLVEMAEEYAVMIVALPDHHLADWAAWYNVTGPREHLRHFLAERYCGSPEEADEILGPPVDATAIGMDD